MKNIFIISMCFFSSFLMAQSSTYYVSHSGEYQSLYDLPTLKPGDKVLLKAGEVWRGHYSISASGEPGAFIYIGRYGDGPNPKILGSKKAEDWTESGVKEHVWQSATSLNNTSAEYYGGRMFFMKDDSVTWGDYKSYQGDFSNLTEEYDYTVGDDDIHYVYCETDPDEVYDSIEVNQRERLLDFNNNSYIEINGIDFYFGRRAGVYSGYPAVRGATDFVFRNCSLGYIGAKSSGSAYGLVCFHSNTLIEDNFFSDCGRRAISINTYTSPSGGRRIENIIVRNNVFKRGFHTTSIDVSCMSQTGDTIRNLYFYNNLIDDSEILREDLEEGHRSNQIFIQGGSSPYLVTDFYIVNNLFIKAQTRWINFDGTGTHYIWNNTFAGFNKNQVTSPYGGIACNGIDTLSLYNNILVDDLPDNNLENNIVHGYKSHETVFFRDHNLYWTKYPGDDRNFTSISTDESSHYFYDIYQWGGFRSTFPEYEAHSPVPAKPKFFDAEGGDYRLSEDSPAKWKGKPMPWIVVTDPFGEVDTINRYDFRRHRPREIHTPSIGALEYDEFSAYETIDNKVFNAVISPNPTRGHIKIQVNGQKPINSINTRMINSAGQIIYEEFFEHTNMINIPFDSEAVSGLYYLELDLNHSHRLVEKVVLNQ